MATVPSKHHQPLHNFSLPFLKWGQRIQANNHCRRRYRNSLLADSSDSDLNNRNKPRRFPNKMNTEIDEENDAVLLDGGNSSGDNRNKPHRFRNNINTEIDEENDAVLPDGGNSSGKLIDVDVSTAANGETKPWNLRPRRFVVDTVDGNSAIAWRSLRGVAAAPPEVENDEEQRRKKKRILWISLSKEEIEEDIYAFTGSRPSRRPKKRNKITQKQLDNVFPGLYLVGISADSYRV